MSIQQERLGDLACWRVRHAGSELLLAEQGAQVLEYRQGDAPPLIWLSEQAEGRTAVSVRGGVPLCWPWFGDLDRNPPALRGQFPGDAPPFHGLVRNIDWQWQAPVREGDELVLRLDCPPAAAGELPGWPCRVAVQLEVRMGQRLTLSLSSCNLGSEAVQISQAMHSYFAISDIRAVQVTGVEGCRYIETLADWQQCVQDGALNFAGETDRIYLDLPDTLQILDPQWQRRICLQGNAGSAVIWNPWNAKAQRLSQFADDAWQRMLCIETADVWDRCVTLLPGESHCLQVSLWGERLSSPGAGS